MSRPPLRRWVQTAALAGFLGLFARTLYRGTDQLDWPVHLVFRLDPLAALAQAIGAGPGSILSWGWAGAGVLLLSTALLGRFFCGWLCPLGTVLGSTGPLLRRSGRDRWSLPQGTAAGVLAALTVAALLGLPLLGVFDPLSLLLRTLTLWLHPLLDAVAKGLLAGLDRISPAAADGAYRVLDPVLAFSRPMFLLSGLTALVFAVVLALERLAPRFWCVNLCPLGAILGCAARLSPLSRSRSTACGPCNACDRACPTGASKRNPARADLCFQCGACERACPQGARVLTWAERNARKAQPVAARRMWITSVAVGVVAGFAPRLRAEEGKRPTDLLRPPGAKRDPEFLLRCIRCGACMRVCPRGALHPTLFEAGLGGVWSPRLVPRVGYCEYHCRLCGQVCPTGAIGYLEAGEKERAVVGIAVFHRDRCIPYRSATNCMVCEEHCPTNPKAIVFEEEQHPDPLGRLRRVKLPRVVDQRCIGCGICENRCPVPGEAAIRVYRAPPADTLLIY